MELVNHVPTAPEVWPWASANNWASKTPGYYCGKQQRLHQPSHRAAVGMAIVDQRALACRRCSCKGDRSTERGHFDRWSGRSDPLDILGFAVNTLTNVA